MSDQASRTHRERVELRALVQDKVLEYTTLLRKQQIAQGMDPDEAQIVEEEYDPVVEMALLAATSNDPKVRLAANAEVAQYTRPKLKSVEVISDQTASANAARKNELIESLADMSRRAVSEKRAAYIEGAKNKAIEAKTANATPAPKQK